MGVVDSSLYQRMRDTASSGVGGVMLQGRDAFPPTTPKVVCVVSEKRAESFVLAFPCNLIKEVLTGNDSTTTAKFRTFFSPS